jgi:predicted nuclease with TOPRIM domain
MTKPRTIYHEDCEWVKKSACLALEKENKRLESQTEVLNSEILKLNMRVTELRSALEYITSKAHFVGQPKWDAEFVEIARLALKGE